MHAYSNQKPGGKTEQAAILKFESRHSDHIENATHKGGIFYVDAVMGFERPAPAQPG